MLANDCHFCWAHLDRKFGNESVFFLDPVEKFQVSKPLIFFGNHAWNKYWSQVLKDNQKTLLPSLLNAKLTLTFFSTFNIWNRLTCLKTTLDGWIKRELTQGTTFISVISSPSISFLPRGNSKLECNFLTAFTVTLLSDEISTTLAGLIRTLAMKHLNLFQPSRSKADQVSQSRLSYYVTVAWRIKFQLRNKRVTSTNFIRTLNETSLNFSRCCYRYSVNKQPTSQERPLIL